MRREVLCGMAGIAVLAFGSLSCGSDGPEGAPQATLNDLQEFVFDPACATSGCHDAVVAGGELDMSTAQLSYDAMVGKPSKNPVAKANGWLIVKPNDPDLSFLVRKMKAPGAGEGDPMPSAAQSIHPYYMELIEEWIANGAPR